MQCEADCSLAGKSCFGITMEDFDVDILIERAGEAVTGRRKNPPAATGWRGVCYGRLVSRIAEPEDGKGLQIPVQEYGPVS